MSVKLILDAVQLAPLLVERKTSPKSFPAKRSVPLTARDKTTVLFTLAEVQLAPLLVDRKTPPIIPAKRFVPETAREKTLGFVKPILAGVQLSPLLVE